MQPKHICLSEHTDLKALYKDNIQKWITVVFEVSFIYIFDISFH